VKTQNHSHDFPQDGAFASSAWGIATPAEPSARVRQRGANSG
jgi:hypothetical protein